MPTTPKILIADDHIMIRKGMRNTLNQLHGYKDIAEAQSCEELLAKLKGNGYSHLILDINLSDGSSLEFLPIIKRLYPDLRIAIHSCLPAAVFAKAIKSDPRIYYISKEAREFEFVQLLGDFIENMTRPRVRSNPDGGNPFINLSPGELIILNYWLSGHKGDDIAQALNVKKNTISTQKRRILDKTGAQNFNELMRLAKVYKVALN